MKDCSRFKIHMGLNYDTAWIDKLSDKELIAMVEEQPTWDIDLMREVCWRAGMINEWEEDTELCEETGYSNFEDIYWRAEAILKEKFSQEETQDSESFDARDEEVEL